MDGFSNEDWNRVTAIAPLSEAMPTNPFDAMGDDVPRSRFGQRLFFDKRGAEAITVDGPSGKGPYTPIDPATGTAVIDPVTMKPKVIAGETGKVSCATCHGSQYLVDARSTYALSHGRSWLTHNTPTMANLGYLRSILWTGSFDSMREHGAGAMGGNSTTLAQIHFIYNFHKDEYTSLFGPLPDALDPTSPEAARFPATGNPKAATTVNGKSVMSADGVFEKLLPEDRQAIYTFKGNMGIVFDAHNRRLTTPNSPFERYVRDQDASAISERAKNGLRLFIGKASCVDCHNGPALSDGQFHNIGVATPMFAPGSTTVPGNPDRGRGGALVGSLNNQLMKLRTNEMLPSELEQVPIFGGAGQYSDNPTEGRRILDDKEQASCVTRSFDVADITSSCQALFFPGSPADDTKTPPVAAKPADARLDYCVRANTPTGVCTKYDDAFEGAFRTPILLNVAKTAPYFHTGEKTTLRDVVVHYNNGGAPAGTFVGTKSSRLRPLGLSDLEIDDLVEFLNTLTGDAPDPAWLCDLSLPRAAAGVGPVFGGACAAE
jgi:cytochrome c peroxidase